MIGTGSCLPGPPISTKDLLVGIEDRFGYKVLRKGGTIARRLGIATRHICRDMVSALEEPRNEHTNPKISFQALRKAITEAGLKDCNKIGYLFGHTTTPHTLLPPNISWVADELSYEGMYVELRQACTGFANALQLGAGLLGNQTVQTVAIVGSETGSVYFDIREAGKDHDQLVNLVQMGDGAGAIVLSPDDGTPGARIESMFFGNVGMGRKPGFYLTGGSGKTYCDTDINLFHQDFMAVKENGKMLFKEAVKAAKSAGINLDTVNWFIPHQANGIIGKVLGSALGIDPGKIFVNADKVGNIGSAAIWIAFDQLRKSGMLKKGDTVLVLGAEATKYLYGGFLYRH